MASLLIVSDISLSFFLSIRRYKGTNPVLNNNVIMLMAPEEPSESTTEEV